MTESHVATIGARIQAERKKSNITLKGLSGKVGLSVPYLSQIENGHVNLNVINLNLIAKALDVRVTDLLAGEDEPDVSLARNGERRWMPMGGNAFESLLVKYRGNFDISIIRLEESSKTGDNSREGEAFTYVISGQVRISVGASGEYDLEAGDVIYYKSSTPHRWENIGDTTAEVLVVNSPSVY